MENEPEFAPVEGGEYGVNRRGDRLGVALGVVMLRDRPPVRRDFEP
jgi:hypothetical protein